MENASKALIIAGAILLAILIIGLGVFIYNQAANTVNDTGMDQLAVRQFNAQFEPYIMERASGATAMALYDTVRTYNATAQSGRLVNLNLVTRAPISRDLLITDKLSNTEGKEDIKMIKLVTPQPGIPPEEAGLDFIKEGISFEKSELSSIKKYNIRVTEYDGGVIKTIDIILINNNIETGEIKK